MVLLLSICSSSCTSDVQATYDFPDLSTGFVISGDGVSVLVGIEMWDYKRFCGDFILAEDLTALGLSWRVTSMFEIKVGMFAGWAFDTEEASYGVCLLITDF